MSFRTRLTSFFVLIVVIPMLAVGFLVFRLISDSQQGKADARVNGVATAAASLYESESAAAPADARPLVRPLARSPGQITARAASLASESGLARVAVRLGGRTVADVGGRTAVSPGAAPAQLQGVGRLTVTTSELTASEYAHELAGPGVAVIVREGSRTLGATLGRLGRG